MTLFFTTRIFYLKFLCSCILVSFFFHSFPFFNGFPISLSILNLIYIKDFSDYSYFNFFLGKFFFDFFFALVFFFFSCVSELQCINSSFLLYFIFLSPSRGSYLCSPQVLWVSQSRIKCSSSSSVGSRL